MDGVGADVSQEGFPDMKRSMIIMLGALSLIPIGLLAASDAEPEPMSGVEPATEFTPTSEYHRLEIHGWPVLVNPSLDDHPVLRKDTIEAAE